MEKDKLIKSPLNYTGGKYKLLPQILPLFPDNINTFVDLFCGGCNVGVNINANKIICNDYINYIIELFDYWSKNSVENTNSYIEETIKEYNLSLTNENGFKQLRTKYNKTKNIADLYVLLCYSFNYQIRFNNNQEYNSSFGKNRSQFSKILKDKLFEFIKTIQSKNIEFTNVDFSEFNFNQLTEKDIVYCDPPYLISCGVYQDGKRGFKGWNEKEEYKLLDILDELHNKNIKFAISNVFESNSKSNNILKEWSKKYTINYLSNTYGNCNYQRKDKDETSTVEVFITNY